MVHVGFCGDLEAKLKPLINFIIRLNPRHPSDSRAYEELERLNNFILPTIIFSSIHTYPIYPIPTSIIQLRYPLIYILCSFSPYPLLLDFDPKAFDIFFTIRSSFLWNSIRSNTLPTFRSLFYTHLSSIYKNCF